MWWNREKKLADPLGPLETDVLEVVWARGESAVRDVAQRLSQPLAYTTVMTTLDRLFKKGLLNRRKEDRAFVYSARFSRVDLESLRARAMVNGFLAGPEPSVLISCLVDAAVQHDEALLNELEAKIRLKREELNRRRQ